MANHYAGQPQPQPQPGQNPYSSPQWGQPAQPGYGAPQGGYGAPQGGYAQPQPGYAQPQPGYGQPQPGPGHPPNAPQPGYGPVHPGGVREPVTLGDITVSGGTITLPTGRLPLHGAIWAALDKSETKEKVTAGGVFEAVTDVLFGWLPSSVTDAVTTGYVEVAVSSAGVHHTTTIPVDNRGAVEILLRQVEHLRTFSA
ncbi:hypothetical protein ACFXPZ_09975 [Streptomyces sp. NPDC059101]|uniref:hypothetical protein n=1 Tax=Streptomyces sp. NPDC059101 TaxID=3346728 RepID=UPI0036C259F9